MQVAMMGDWFRCLELTIPFAEFMRLPRHPAYKYEYFGGRAVLTPRPHSRHASVELAALPPAHSPSSVPDTVVIRPLEPGDWAHLPELLAAAFHNVPPFAALGEEDRLRAAQDCLGHTQAGGDGSLLEPACFVAVDTGRPTAPEGAVLITAVPSGDAPHLTWIMLSPWRVGQGLGSALLRSAATALRALGYRELISTFLVGNERSALWHWRNGFRLVPDSWTPRLNPPHQVSLAPASE